MYHRPAGPMYVHFNTVSQHFGAETKSRESAKQRSVGGRMTSKLCPDLNATQPIGATRKAVKLRCKVVCKISNQSQQKDYLKSHCSSVGTSSWSNCAEDYKRHNRQKMLKLILLKYFSLADPPINLFTHNFSLINFI